MAADKPSKKTVGVLVQRSRPFPPKIIVAVGAKIRFDKDTGLIDVFLQAGGQSHQRVRVDASLMVSNYRGLEEYVAGMPVDADESILKEEVLVTEPAACANIVHFCQSGGRAETIFGIYSMSDFVEATRETDTSKHMVESVDNVVALSTAGFQKKLLLELLLIVRQELMK